ncbi:hypothetical protein F8M41_008569 [Gigaspora margarita]|uniref:Uncharacterized protein n=1 Tax=Gigaspora margarita TaxID=4874 RepID=A0A8H4AVK8_GIGMA|nr:hypothetical protein F8M41_008569 [Gigaspora margarita]
MGKGNFNKLVNIQWALNEMDIEIEQCDHENDNDIWECVKNKLSTHEYFNPLSKTNKECVNKEHSEENQNKTSSADNLINKSLSNSKSKIIESLNDKKMNVNVNVSMDTIEVNIRVVLLEIMKTSDWIETQIDTQQCWHMTRS